MRISKIYLFSFIFLIVSIVYFSVVLNVSAEENELVAQVSRQGVTPSVQPQPKPQLDCKATCTQEKESNKEKCKLVGKDCKELLQKLNAEGQTRGKCCECWNDDGDITCVGSCCKRAISRFVTIR
jgi:hypothetical protein